MYQTSIRQSVSITGIGLHGGKEVRLTLHPAPADTGLIFYVHTTDGIRRINPSPEAVLTTELATTLGTSDKVSVSTVEHLMAALRGLAVDNVAIHVEGGEIPIMDGSASAFVDLLTKAGICQLGAFRHFWGLSRAFVMQDGQKLIRATPYNGFKIDCTIDFPHPAIGRERFVLELTPNSFKKVASARTFGFLRDVEYLHSHGLARGGSLENVVVLDDQGVVNPEGLRTPDEFVRHKTLDFIGDMANLDLPLRGSFELVCSGHQFNNLFLRKLKAEHLLYEYTEDFSHLGTRRSILVHNEPLAVTA